MDPFQRAIDYLAAETAVRRALIAIHGVFGLWVGITMILTGAPPPAEEWWGPEIRYVLGVFGAVFGALAIYGVRRGDHDRRGWVTAFSGMLGLTFWHMSMMLIYAYHAATGDLHILGLTEVARTDERPYIGFVYLTLALLTAAHCIALKRFGRPDH